MLVPIRISKISSNRRQELVYIPKKAVRMLELRKGTDVVIYMDTKERCLIIKPIKLDLSEVRT